MRRIVEAIIQWALLGLIPFILALVFLSPWYAKAHQEPTIRDRLNIQTQLQRVSIAQWTWLCTHLEPRSVVQMHETAQIRVALLVSEDVTLEEWCNSELYLKVK